jgi:stress-induced morphogen
LLHKDSNKTTFYPGVLMTISQVELENHLNQHFPNSTIVLKDTVGDENHYDATIISPAFKGLSRIERHRMVNTALADLLAGPLHAISLTLSTPEE